MWHIEILVHTTRIAHACIEAWNVSTGPPKKSLLLSFTFMTQFLYDVRFSFYDNKNVFLMSGHSNSFC